MSPQSLLDFSSAFGLTPFIDLLEHLSDSRLLLSLPSSGFDWFIQLFIIGVLPLYLSLLLASFAVPSFVSVCDLVEPCLHLPGLE